MSEYLRIRERVGQIGDEQSGRAVFTFGSGFASLFRFLPLSHPSLFGGDGLRKPASFSTSLDSLRTSTWGFQDSGIQN